MHYSADLAGLELEHPIMNGAGTCKTLEQVKDLAKSAVSAIVVGSITIDPRQGNSDNTYYQTMGSSLNALGLPNPGSRYYQENLPEMVEIAHSADKKLIVSVAGLNVLDFGRLVSIALEGGADLVEANFGCPNVQHEQGRIFSYDIKTLKECLRFLWGYEDVGIKLSPYSDPSQLQQTAETIDHGSFKPAFLTVCNTFPNGFALSNGRHAISPNNGLAGVGGQAMRLIGQGQVFQWRQALPNLPIIGVGGISHGQHVLDYLQTGASAVQIATAYLERGESPAVFSQLLTEYVNLSA